MEGDGGTTSIISAQTKIRPIIALIIERTDNQFQTEIWSAIVKKAEENGINLLSFSLGRDAEYYSVDYYKSSIMNLINSEKIDGFIILTAVFLSQTEEKSREFINFVKTLRHVPCVSIGAEVEGTSGLIVDNKRGMEELLKHLIGDHGYGKIGFIKGPASNPEAAVRFETYQRMLEKHRIAYDENRVFEGDFLFDRLVRKEKEVDGIFEAIFENITAMDAIVAANDAMAVSLLKKLKEYGINVPADVAVAGFDDINLSRSSLPQLTTVHQPLYELGAVAFDTLLSGIKGKKMPVKKVLPTNLIIRRSCGCFSYLAVNTGGRHKQQGRTPEDHKENEKIVIINDIRKIIEERTDTDVHREVIKGWAETLVDALLENIKKRESKYFLITLEKIIREGIECHIEVLHWNAVIFELLEQVKLLATTVGEKDWIDGVWKEALV
jgi:sigma-B regulation protein RsbU (phosphoserine phosphatase)